MIKYIIFLESYGFLLLFGTIQFAENDIYLGSWAIWGFLAIFSFLKLPSGAKLVHFSPSFKLTI